MAEPKAISPCTRPPSLPPELREDCFKVFFGTLTEAVYAVDLSNWTIAYWNNGATSLFGYSDREAAGRKIQLLHSDPASLGRMLNMAVPAVHEKGYWRGSLEYQRRNGSRFEAEAFAMALFPTPPTIYIAVMHDPKGKGEEEASGRKAEEEIAERKRLEAKLRSQELLATIGTTAAQLAHEVGNPLNGMYTTVQILERHLAKKDSVDETAASIVRDLMNEINRLRSLLHDFRSLARPEQLDLQPVDLAAMAAELLAIEEPQYAERGIRVEQDFAPDLRPVKADSEKLKQALLNLCKNAVEAMPEGGTLTVRGYRSGEQVMLEVSDTGTGLPEGMDIFEIFATSKPYGSGFGLAIVQQIVSAHDGTVSHASEPGKGTTFRITLPLD